MTWAHYLIVVSPKTEAIADSGMESMGWGSWETGGYASLHSSLSFTPVLIIAKAETHCLLGLSPRRVCSEKSTQTEPYSPPLSLYALSVAEPFTFSKLFDVHVNRNKLEKSASRKGVAFTCFPIHFNGMGCM